MLEGKERLNSPAADAKTDYIIEVLNRIGYAVDLLSLAPSPDYRFSPSFSYRKGGNSFLFFTTFRIGKGPAGSLMYRWLMQVQLLVWCLFHLKRKEQILVYHSLGYDFVFVVLKRILSLNIIGEIEEVYQDVHKQRRFQEIYEYRFINGCSKFIFPNNVLAERLKVSFRPSVVVHGAYHISPRMARLAPYETTHILYAGTFDPVKGGAIMAVKTAEFLTDRYHLHICGFGSAENVSLIRNEIDHTNNCSRCKVTFHGHLSRTELKALYDICSVGLCTQNPNVLLNYTSFPSKILEYMANGLVVISGKNTVIERSAVGRYVFYYEEHDARSIADSIMSIDFSSIPDYQLVLRKLDNQFSVELEKLVLC